MANQLIFVISISCASFFVSEGLYRAVKDIPKVCNKTYFEETYVKPKREIEKSVLEDLTQCQPANCEGSSELVATYMEKKETGEYFYMLQTADDIDNAENAGCWGFVIEVHSEEKSYTLYENYGNKNSSLLWFVKTLPDQTFVFRLTSIPVGYEAEMLALKSPSVCGNKVLKELHTRLTKYNCKPSFNVQKKIAEDICKLAPKSSQRQSEIITSNLVETNCDFFLNVTTSPPPLVTHSDGCVNHINFLVSAMLLAILYVLQ